MVSLSWWKNEEYPNVKIWLFQGGCGWEKTKDYLQSLAAQFDSWDLHTLLFLHFQQDHGATEDDTTKMIKKKKKRKNTGLLTFR